MAEFTVTSAFNTFKVFCDTILKSFSLKIREFDAKMREYFPKKPSVGRTEFKDLQDLADYLVSEDRKAEMTKLNKQLADETEGFTDSSCEHS